MKEKTNDLSQNNESTKSTRASQPQQDLHYKVSRNIVVESTHGAGDELPPPPHAPPYMSPPSHTCKFSYIVFWHTAKLFTCWSNGSWYNDLKRKTGPKVKVIYLLLWIYLLVLRPRVSAKRRTIVFSTVRPSLQQIIELSKKNQVFYTFNGMNHVRLSVCLSACPSVDT